MLRAFFGVLILLLIQAGAGHAQGQDTLKIDTNLLKKLRIEPHRDFLTVPRPPILIQPEPIPVTLLNYQPTYWRKWLTLGVNVNQSAFSSNWSGGGVSAFAVGTNVDFKTEYNKQPFDYTSETILLYGKSKNKGQAARKTNDRIFFDNKIANQLSKKWYFFGSLSFESQFDEGFQYNDAAGTPPVLISKFLSPGYITESVGFEYKPNTYLDFRFGTGTARQTLVLDTTIYHNIPGNYGVTPGQRFRNELAFQIVSTINKDIAKNMNLQARYLIFVPYNYFARTDHRLDATLTAHVNRLINVTITGTILYDITTASSVQASQGLAMGMVYKFP
jgi:hypothetical protein